MLKGKMSTSCHASDVKDREDTNTGDTGKFHSEKKQLY